MDETDSANTLSALDKLEVVCTMVLLSIFVLGLICVGLAPEEGSTSSIVVCVVVVVLLIFPLAGALYLRTQEGERCQASRARSASQAHLDAWVPPEPAGMDECLALMPENMARGSF